MYLFVPGRLLVLDGKKKNKNKTNQQTNKQKQNKTKQKKLANPTKKLIVVECFYL